MTRKYRIDIDGISGGPWMGHLLHEIGCIWLAPTRGAVMEQAPEAIAAFYAWLRRHGEPGLVEVRPDPTQIVAGHTQEIVSFGQSGAAVGVFPWDLEPVTEQEIHIAVRRLGHARRDLLELVAALPEEALDWAPPGNRRTIRKNLIHLRNAQGFYITRLFGWDRALALLPDPWPEENLFSSLSWVMERVSGAIVAMPEELRTGTFLAEQPSETWTARKMLRRIVEHEREHVEVVRRTAQAWAGEPADTRPWVTAPARL